MKSTHNHDNIWGAVTATLVSIFQSTKSHLNSLGDFFAHLDWIAVTQSVVSAVLGYIAVSLVSHLIKKK